MAEISEADVERGASDWLPDAPAEAGLLWEPKRLDNADREETLRHLERNLDRVEEHTGVPTREDAAAAELRAELEARLEALEYRHGSFRDRLEQFALEAGLQGAPHDHLADALRELTDPDAVIRWGTDAGKRALLLRLRWYGVWQGGIAEIERLGTELHAVGAALGVSVASAQSLVSNHDRLVRWLADAGAGASGDDARSALVRGVVGVELWISGLAAAPYGHQGVPQLDQAVARARQLLGTPGAGVDAALVAALAEDRAVDTPVTPTVAAGFVERWLEELKPVWRRVRHAFRTVFDGVGRALAWLGRRFERLKQGFAEWFRQDEGGALVAALNALRAVRAFGARVFTRVREVAGQYGQAIDEALRGVYQPRDGHRAAIAFVGLDRDARVWVGDDATPADLRELARRSRRIATVIELAGRVVGLVVALLAGVASGGTTLLAFVCAVVRQHDDILACHRAIVSSEGG